jgi:hypothetical protein
VAEYARAALLWKGALCGVPPTLGSIGSLEPEHAFDTLLTDVARTGVWPYVAREYEACWQPHTRVLLVVNPVWAPPQEFLDRLGSFVRGGGLLVLLDQPNATPQTSSAELILAATGLVAQRPRPGWVAPDPAEGPRLSPVAGSAEWYGAEIGAGRVLFHPDSVGLSRQGLGHSFSLPDEPQRQRLAVLYAALEATLPTGQSRPPTYDILETDA